MLSQYSCLCIHITFFSIMFVIVHVCTTGSQPNHWTSSRILVSVIVDVQSRAARCYKVRIYKPPFLPRVFQRPSPPPPPPPHLDIPPHGALCWVIHFPAFDGALHWVLCHPHHPARGALHWVICCNTHSLGTFKLKLASAGQLPWVPILHTHNIEFPPSPLRQWSNHVD